MGLDEALAGLSGAPPKKSRPPSSCEGCSAGFEGGGHVDALSVVLGLTGGAGSSSPKRSRVCEVCLGGG